MRRSRLVINKRLPRAQMITHLILNIVRQYAKFEEPDDEEDFVRELQDQLWADGAQMITEGDRIAAGLQPRNIDGLTVDELCIMEARTTMAMLKPVMPIMVQADMAHELGAAWSNDPGHITWLSKIKKCPICGYEEPGTTVPGLTSTKTDAK